MRSPGIFSGVYVPHPLANLFPIIEGDAFWDLVADIKAHGVRDPVVMLDGMVLDGRNRYLAAREAGRPVPTVEYDGDDALAFVLSLNLKRRHLTDAQRAMVAAKIAKLPQGGNRQPDQTANWRDAPSTAEAADMLSVPVRSVERARTIQTSGTPALVAEVEAGHVSVSAAAEVAKLPEVEQAAIVEAGPKAIRQAAKVARRPKPPADPEPAPPVDAERAEIARLTPDAMIDEIIGLRDENRELRAQHRAAKDEAADLKVRLKEATAENQGAVIGSLQKELRAAKFARDEALSAAKRMEHRSKKAEARVKELEDTPIPMDAA